MKKKNKNKMKQNNYHYYIKKIAFEFLIMKNKNG